MSFSDPIIFIPAKRQPRFIRQERYREYLKSEHWLDLRTRKLAEAGHKCEECGSTGPLEVHHKAYRKQWTDTELFELQVLCRACHEQAHTPKPKVFHQHHFPVRQPPKPSKRSLRRQRHAFREKKRRLGWSF